MNKPTIIFHKNFEKQLAKLNKKRREKAIDAVGQFLQDPTLPSLRSHALRGDWEGYHSISAGGDLRLHFRMMDATTVFFVAVGNHSQLYK